MDGFFMYCTSNLDGTGSCTNEEDGRAFACMIVPGQIITCPAKQMATVDCVWISGITENQAQFWCNPENERAIYNNDNTSSLDMQNRGSNPGATSEADGTDAFINSF
jgi:hypothetical protein